MLRTATVLLRRRKDGHLPGRGAPSMGIGRRCPRSRWAATIRPRQAAGDEQRSASGPETMSASAGTVGSRTPLINEYRLVA